VVIVKEHRFVQGRKKLSVMVHNLNLASAASPVVVFCHGFTGDKIGPNQLLLNLALALDEAGKTVVRFDFAGSGESEGVFAEDTTVSGWLEDLRTIIAWIKSAPEFAGAPIVLAGHSLGGLLTLIYPDDAAIIKRIAMAAVVHPLATFAAEGLLGPDRWQRAAAGETVANFLNKGFALKDGIFVNDLIRNDYQPLKAAAALSTPLLIIHGSADCVVPFAGSEELFQLYKGKKRFHRLAGVDHVFAGNHGVVQSLLVDWLTGHRQAE
jgi:Dipeptidyl aminopeptidases/acylaminoacyl-peptidases